MGKADLHIHTRVSDGMASVEQVVDYAEMATDLDVIAVTDHEDARGGLRAQEYAARRGYTIDVIPGAEVTTLHGHVLALFVEEAPPAIRSIERTLERIHHDGGLAIVPHPMSWLTRSVSHRTLARLGPHRNADVWIDAIELANPSPAGLSTHERALRLNERLGLPGVGASDAHHLLHIASGWTTFEGCTADDLRRSLQAGRVEPCMTRYASVFEVGVRNIALGLAWGYSATPRKLARKCLPGGRRAAATGRA